MDVQRSLMELVKLMAPSQRRRKSQILPPEKSQEQVFHVRESYRTIAIVAM